MRLSGAASLARGRALARRAALEAHLFAGIVRAGSGGTVCGRRRSLEALKAEAAGRRCEERHEEVEKNGVDEHGHEAGLARHHDALAAGRQRQQNAGGEENE